MGISGFGRVSRPAGFLPLTEINQPEKEKTSWLYPFIRISSLEDSMSCSSSARSDPDTTSAKPIE